MVTSGWSLNYKNFDILVRMQGIIEGTDNMIMADGGEIRNKGLLILTWDKYERLLKIMLNSKLIRENLMKPINT